MMGVEIQGIYDLQVCCPGFFSKEILGLSLLSMSNHFLFSFGIVTISLVFLLTLISIFCKRLNDHQVQEKALVESDQRFQRLIQEMQIGVLLLNNRAEILMSNQSAQTLLNLKKDTQTPQIFGQNWHWVQEDYLAVPEEQFPVQLAIRNRQPIRNMTLGIPDSNSPVQYQWILVNATPQIAEDGRVERVICTIGDITQQKQTEADLRASEERFSLVIEGANDGIWDWEINTGNTYISPRWKTMFGYFDQELTNQMESFKKILHPEDSERVFGILERYLNREISQYEVEFRGVTKLGSIRWIMTRGVALWDSNNKPYRMVGSNTDITERKQVEEALKESAKRERSIIQVIQRMRETLELKTIFNATTEELRQALCCSRVLVYRFNPDWSGEVIAESVMSGWTKLIQTTEDQLDFLRVTVNQCDCTVKLLENGEALIEDTYLKENKGGLFQRKGKSYYRCVPDIYTAGFDECYLNLLEQLQARSYLIAPIFCGTNLWGLLCAYQNGTPRQWTTAEIKILTQIGSQLGVAVQQAELFAKTQQQAEELKKAKEAADAANSAKSEFLASMSHELRTPLNAILGFATLMNNDSSIKTEHHQYLDIISRSGENLLQLINDILERSKIEAGRVTLTEDDFDLTSLIENLEEMLRLKAKMKGIALIFEIDNTLPQWVRGDEKKLRQVLINLLGNAIKFTQVGTVRLRAIRVDNNDIQTPKESLVNHKPITLRFEVSDTGPGIAENEVSRLFKAFSQTKTGLQSSEGTGLGLSISQKFVQLMGGEITVQSQVEVGSTFAFEICLTDTHPPENQVTLTEQKIIGLAPGQPNTRILIAEDKPANRLLITKILSDIGFDLQTANNGQEAVEIWSSWQPDLILINIRMPILNGLEATQQINALSTGKKKPVIIALTATVFEEDKKAILNAGCDDFIGKPFKREELLEVIAKHLGVQYIYASDETQKTNSSNQSSDLENMQLTSSSKALETMQNEWIEQLYQAAQACSDLLILELIEQIPKDKKMLAEVLKELVDDFRYDQIIELVEPLISVQYS